MTNPLLQKYEELYGKKEEPVVEEKYEMPPEWDVRSVTTSNNPYINTKSNHIPITKLKSYDKESLNDGFLQIAEKLKNKEAQVSSMNIDIDQLSRTKRITFEVWDNF
jgi:hypothetical protein